MRFMKGHAWVVLGRGVILALFLPLALASSLPAFARALGGPTVHVCHCAMSGGHSTCTCPICHPNRADFRLSEEAIRGTCGDPDLVFGGSLAVALPTTPGFAILRPPARPAWSPNLDGRDPGVVRSPPTPPPRVASV